MQFIFDVGVVARLEQLGTGFAHLPFRAAFVRRIKVLLLEDCAHGMAYPPNNTIEGGVCQPYRGNSSRWTIQQGFCSSYGEVQHLGSGVASLRQARLLLKLQDQS